MLCRCRYFFMVPVVAAFLSGCSEQGDRLNAPPQGASARRSALQQPFIQMTDNEMIEDTSIADIHFVPHVAELSGLGVRRLTRMGELFSVCGGTIHYATSIKDKDLIDARLDKVREFLLAEGVDLEKVHVEAGMSQGRGTDAIDSIINKEKVSAAAAGPGPAGVVGAPPTVVP